MTPIAETRGGLVYVMGPSGAGKDTLIEYARARTDPTAVAFAHRFITRSAEAGGENHVMLSDTEFAARREAGLFALSWNSHGFWYGIGVEIDLWLNHGLIVVVSGSRAAWPQAKARYPGLLGLMIEAPPAVRAARLAARRRENEDAIRARLERDVSLPDEELRRIDNVGTVAAAGNKLVELLQRAAFPSR